MKSSNCRQGPLAGLKVLEFKGIGPGPHCAMLLSDMGAEVLSIEKEFGNGWDNPVVDRGRRRISIDIRSSAGKEKCLELFQKADVVIEGFRPGVMERLGLGPKEAHAANPRLIYGRVTGWGQTGPLAKSAGHDINYIALTGALAAMGDPSECPRPPLNLVGDFGGGSMYLAFGIVSALWEREKSGLGQVIDAAMIDGVSSMMSFFTGLIPSKKISLARGQNVLSGSAPNYRCYRCADGQMIAVGALEPQFLRVLLQAIGASVQLIDPESDSSSWMQKSERLAELFATRTREEWCSLLEGTDACFAPVLSFAEAVEHPHIRDRNIYQERDGVLHVAPAPRFSRTPGAIQTGESEPFDWE
ncbi:CaiB/BaiF CoA-transferase family protein [Pseudomonas sp. SAS7]